MRPLMNTTPFHRYTPWVGSLPVWKLCHLYKLSMICWKIRLFLGKPMNLDMSHVDPNLWPIPTIYMGYIITSLPTSNSTSIASYISKGYIYLLYTFVELKNWINPFIITYNLEMGWCYQFYINIQIHINEFLQFGTLCCHGTMSLLIPSQCLSVVVPCYGQDNIRQHSFRLIVFQVDNNNK